MWRMDQAQLFDILSRYDRRKKYFRLKDGSFLDVSDGQLRELSALKNGLQISDRELKKERLRFRPIVLCIWTVS